MNKDVKHFESLYPIDSREPELSQIVRFIREGNSAQIISLPGVGRSNILGLLAHNREVRGKHFPTKNDFVHFVNVDFSELRSRPLIDVTKLMFLNLVDSLRERDMQEEYVAVNDIFTETLKLQDGFVIFQGLKRAVEYLAVEKKLTLIFLMDRFEEYVPMLTQAFFSNLRTLRNIAKYRFSVIFTLFKPLEDVLEAEMLAGFYEFVAGHVIYLGLVDEPSLNFRLKYLEQLTGKTLDPIQRSEMLRLTGGHWKLTRLSAESLLASPPVILPSPASGGSTSEESGPNNSLSEFLLKQKTITGALNEILRAFSPAERKVLTSVILSDDEESSPENSAIDDNTLSHFKNIGLVTDSRLSIPLLAEYLATQKPQEEKQVIIYDEGKNVIRKGETVLSDGLTAAEFRLLAYLLRNPDRVISRDEVIDVVWKEAKSTAGVTDQAVDQLIFRIRRKIETDPNSPQHLKTIKGRGFSFTA